MVDIGRIDINNEVSLLEYQLSLPQEVHLDTLFHIFSYLRQKYNSRLAFDPTYPDIDMMNFKGCGWKHFYGGTTETIPTNAPDPK